MIFVSYLISRQYCRPTHGGSDIKVRHITPYIQSLQVCHFCTSSMSNSCSRVNSVSIEILSCAVYVYRFNFTIFLPCGNGWTVDAAISIIPFSRFCVLLFWTHCESAHSGAAQSSLLSLFWYVYDLSAYPRVFRPYLGLLHWLQHHLLSFRHCHSRSLCPLVDVACTGFQPYYLGRTVHLSSYP